MSKPKTEENCDEFPAIQWGTVGNKKPPGKPKCGFNNKAPGCNSKGVGHLWLWIGCIAGVFLLGLAITVPFLLRRLAKFCGQR